MNGVTSTMIQFVRGVPCYVSLAMRYAHVVWSIYFQTCLILFLPHTANLAGCDWGHAMYGVNRTSAHHSNW